MNYLINKCEKKTTFSKEKFLGVNKGDLISVIYFDIEKEKTLVQAFMGRCVKIKKRNLSTKIVIQNIVLNTLFKQSFFLYSPNFLDLKIFQRKN